MIKFENKTNGRFYYLSLHKDLLGDVGIRINYGGRHVCRVRFIACTSGLELQKQIEQLSKRRIKRGYSLVT